MEYSVLEKIGLTKSEILVYTSLLKIGQSSTGKIVKEAKISSGKIYEILDKLIEKGLVSFSITNNVKYFESSNPEKIKDYLKRKKRELDKTSFEINQILPHLKEIKKRTKKEHPTMIYEGIEGIKTVIFNTLRGMKKSDEWLAMGISLDRSKQINNLWEKWFLEKEKLRKKNKIKVIVTDQKSVEFYQPRVAEIRFLKGLTPSPTGIVGNKVIVYDWEKPSAVVIENEKIATSFRTFFDSLWKHAKPVKSKR